MGGLSLEILHKARSIDLAFRFTKHTSVLGAFEIFSREYMGPLYLISLEEMETPVFTEFIFPQLL